MDRVLQGSRSVVHITLFDGETATDSTTAVTVEVLRDNGTVAVVAGAATTNETGLGAYSYALTPAVLAELDVLTIRWSATIGGSAQVFTTQVEVVGGFYFSPADLRALPGLHDQARFPTTMLVEQRDRVETLFERVLRTSVVGRYRRRVVDGTGDFRLALPEIYVRRLIGVTIDDDALDAGELADVHVSPAGILTRRSYEPFTWGYGNVDVRYVVQATDAVPADLAEAALSLARQRLLAVESNIPSRARSISNEFGNINLAFATVERPTGIDDVDAVLVGWRDRLAVSAVA